MRPEEEIGVWFEGIIDVVGKGWGKYLGCLRLDLPGTSEGAVDFSHDG